MQFKNVKKIQLDASSSLMHQGNYKTDLFKKGLYLFMSVKLTQLLPTAIGNK